MKSFSKIVSIAFAMLLALNLNANAGAPGTGKYLAIVGIIAGTAVVGGTVAHITCKNSTVPKQKAGWKLCCRAFPKLCKTTPTCQEDQSACTPDELCKVYPSLLECKATPTCANDKKFCTTEEELCKNHPSEQICKKCDTWDPVTRTCPPEAPICPDDSEIDRSTGQCVPRSGPGPGPGPGPGGVSEPIGILVALTSLALFFGMRRRK